MMNTPICDFVRGYAEKGGVRLHMPGHKGRAALGPEPRDITEIRGADELYRACGIIRQSEENAAALFGAGRTLYSTEGSSLCIRAMVHLALLNAKAQDRPPLILAGRNAHRAFLSAAALLGAEIRWVFNETDQSMLSCSLTPPRLDALLNEMRLPPAAVYVTSPDYLGNLSDIQGLAEVCHAHDTALLVDNAHGAYLRFLPEDRHPMTLGADLCCDSAHKTLPVLTGGAYLHVAKAAPPMFAEMAESAMALFASTSPSYLILQSLDLCNACLADGYREKLALLCRRTDEMKDRLTRNGYRLAGDEKCKITVSAKPYGYTGEALHGLLRSAGIECEYSDPDVLTMMLSPELTASEIEKAENALLAVPRRAAIREEPPELPRPDAPALSPRQAMLLPGREIPVAEAEGRILADARTGCPPCVPILVCGERIDSRAIRCFRYYGIGTCRVVDA